MADRRPRQDWFEMGFKHGDTWTLGETGDVVIVENERELRYRGYVRALTPLTKLIRKDHPNLKGRIGRILTFKGETIEELYNRTYGTKENIKKY